MPTALIVRTAGRRGPAPRVPRPGARALPHAPGGGLAGRARASRRSCSTCPRRIAPTTAEADGAPDLLRPAAGLAARERVATARARASPSSPGSRPQSRTGSTSSTCSCRRSSRTPRPRGRCSTPCSPNECPNTRSKPRARAMRPIPRRPGAREFHFPRTADGARSPLPLRQFARPAAAARRRGRRRPS